MQMLPVGYLVFNLNAVLDMRKGYLRPSQLFCSTLALFLAFSDFSSPIPTNQVGWQQFKDQIHCVGDTAYSCRVNTFANFVGFVTMWLGPLWLYLVHRHRRRKGETFTLAANACMFVFLLCIGFQNLCANIQVQMLQVKGLLKTRSPFSWLLFGPIHVVPTLAMLCYRREAVRQLAHRWLKTR
jgi:hypothetical protein